MVAQLRRACCSTGSRHNIQPMNQDGRNFSNNNDHTNELAASDVIKGQVTLDKGNICRDHVLHEQHTEQFNTAPCSTISRWFGQVSCFFSTAVLRNQSQPHSRRKHATARLQVSPRKGEMVPSSPASIFIKTVFPAVTCNVQKCQVQIQTFICGASPDRVLVPCCLPLYFPQPHNE